MNCPFIIEWSYAWIRYESDTLLHSPTIHPRITAQMGQGGGQGTNGLTRQEMCVLSCILLEVSSHMPSTCQGVALRGQLEDVVSSCAGNPRIWPWKKKKRSWYVGYVWSSRTSRLLNVWDQSGISWRNDVRILSACTWVAFMQPCTSKEAVACACMCPHIQYFLSVHLPLSYAVITITPGEHLSLSLQPPFQSEAPCSSQMIAINSLQRLLDGRLTTFYVVDTLLTRAACSQLQMKDSW